MERDEQFIATVQLLQGALQADPTVRQAAEHRLLELRAADGFGTAVTKVVVSGPGAPPGVRQMGALVLRQYVRSRWLTDDEYGGAGHGFGPPHSPPPGPPLPPASDTEKASMRGLLLAGLGDPDSKLRTAVGMVVAEVAKHELPGGWPELLPALTGAIAQAADANLVEGALRCLSLFADELEEGQLVALSHALLPHVLRLLALPPGQLPPRLRRKALTMLRSVLKACEHMDEQSDAQFRSVWSPHLPQLVEVLRTTITSPLVPNDYDDYGSKLQSLGALLRLLTGFGPAMEAHTPGCLASCWSLMVEALPVYLKNEVAVEEEDAGVVVAAEEADGELLTLEAVLSQLFEVLLCVAGNQRYVSLLASHLQELCYQCLGFLCITSAQAGRWAADPNEFIADEEDDLTSARVSVELLVEELIETYDLDAFAALDSALRRRLAEASAARQAGDPMWWKQREACAHMLGCFAHHFVEAREEGEELPLDALELLGTLLHEDLPQGGAAPFLSGRVLWVAGRMSELLSDQLVSSVALCAAEFMGPHLPLVLRIGACRAVVAVAQRSPEALTPVLDKIYTGVGALLDECGDECIHLALETLPDVIAAHPGSAASMCAQVTPRVLTVWQENAADPLLGEDCLDVLEAMARLPECGAQMQSMLLPQLLPLLHAAANSPTGVPFGGDGRGRDPSAVVQLANAVQLLALLVQHASPDAARHMHAAVFGPLLRLGQGCQEPEVAQELTECLRHFLRIGGADVLSWNGSDPREAAAALAGCCACLLERGDSSAAFMGRLLLQMLATIPNQVAPHLARVMDAAARQAAAGSIVLQEQVLLFFAYLMHLDAPTTVGYLASKTLPGLGSCSLEVVLQMWAARHSDLRGKAQRKLAAVGAGVLLTLPQPELDAMQTRGSRLEPAGGGSGSGVRTRQQAAAAGPERWSSVSMRTKLLMLLAQDLVEAKMDHLNDEDDEVDEGGAGEALVPGSAGQDAAHTIPGLGGGGGFGGYRGGGEADDTVPDVAPGASVRQCAAAALRQLAAVDVAFLHAGAPHLTPAQRQAIERALQ